MGYSCSGGTYNTASDTCTEICGDGIDLQNYGCDDDNLVPGDGCDQFCNVEPCWTCEGGDRNTGDVCWHWDKVPAITNVVMTDMNYMIVTFNTSVSLPTDWIDYVDVLVIMDGPRRMRNYYVVSHFA